LNDKAAALYGLYYAIGAIIGPLAGSFVFDDLTKKDWHLTCDIFAIVSGVYTLLFLVMNVLPDIHKEKELRQQ
jgi:MFS family permease